MPDCAHLPIALRRWLVAGVCLATSVATPAQSCALICKSNVNAALNGFGQVLINEQMIAPTAPTYCPGQLTLTLFDENGDSAPNPLTCAYSGQTVTVIVEHVASGNTCEGSVDVADFLPPNLICPEIFALCTQDPDPAFIGMPAMSDNCTPAAMLSVFYDDQFVDLPCNTTYNGQVVTARIDRNWQAADESGNTAACLQKIWIKRGVLADVAFPPSHDGFQAPALDCSQDPNNLNLTGEPSIEGQIIQPGGNCDLAAVYSDQIANTCGAGGYTVFRTWTVSDFCGGGSTQKIQVIKVQDQTPPQLTPPADLTVGTTDLDCLGLVELSDASATDDCSTVSIQPSWGFGTGYGPFLVPKGTHTVTYTATDACGNSATATATVTVEDDDPPQVICNADLQVAVSAAGVGYVLPQTLDAGSWDNCDAITLTISRDGDNFSGSVAVTCADIGTPLLLTMRAADAAGLENFCQVEVAVRDFVKPNLQCPANVTLSCDADFTDLQSTGQATASDNCTLQSLDYTDIINVNACNAGTVTRTWQAADNAGNTRVCAQQITLNAVGSIAVVFPPDLTLSDCAGADALLPAATGTPAVTGQSCSPVSITYADQAFAAPPPPACFSLLRTWKVIDWCLYNPNGGSAGYWEHVQLITVEDHTPPVLNVPPDLTVAAAPGGCVATIALPPVEALDCSGATTVTHNSVYAAAPGADASGVYPVGEHEIVFSTSDNCGNLIQQTLRITVLDQTAPAAVCRNGLILELDGAGTVVLNAAALNDGSSDNCTTPAALDFAAAPMEFSCAQLGQQPVLLTVADAAGNVAACQTLVQVQDPNGVCGGGDTYNIYGDIRTETLAPVAEIPVELSLGGATLFVACDTNGHYLFEDLPDGAATLRPYGNANWTNGVSTFDLVLISKHILGITPLNSPYKMIAADANRSGSVTTFDIVVLRKLLLGLSDTVAGNTSWRFLDASHVFSNSDNPFDGPLPETIALDSLTGPLPSLDFIGIKVGDVNNSTDPGEARSPGDTVRLQLPGLALHAGQPVEIPLLLENWPALEGFQFAIAFDSAKIALEKLVFPHPQAFNEHHLGRPRDGLLTASWDRFSGGRPDRAGQPLIILRLKARQDVPLRECIQLAPRDLACEAYRPGSDAASPIALQTGGENRPATAAAVFAGQPNPFRETTRIFIPLAAPASLRLTVSDPLGRVVLVKQAAFPRGEAVFVVDKTELPHPGLYFYRIDSAAEPAVAGAGRLVLVGN